MSTRKIFTVLSLFVALTNADQGSLIVKYRDACDKLDIDSLLKNSVLVNAYLNCLLNRGPCTKYGHMVKSIIPEIMSTSCANCSPNQKNMVQRIMQFMYTNRRADFDALLDFYDPERRYHSSMMNFMWYGDHVSDLQASSSDSYMYVPRHSLRPMPYAFHQSSTLSSAATSHRPGSSRRPSRSPKMTPPSTKPTPETDSHKAHRTHLTHTTQLISTHSKIGPN